MLADVRMTSEQYLEAEKSSEVRHEFVDGVMHAMAGDKKRNNRIVKRLVRLLDSKGRSSRLRCILHCCQNARAKQQVSLPRRGGDLR